MILTKHPPARLDNREKFQCPDCEYCSKKQKSFHDHIEFVHKGMRLKCPLCNTKFASHLSYNKHSCIGVNENLINHYLIIYIFYLDNFVRNLIYIIHLQDLDVDLAPEIVYEKIKALEPGKRWTGHSVSLVVEKSKQA